MAENETEVVFTANSAQLESVLKRLVKEIRRFATVTENATAQLQGGFNQAAQASARLQTQQQKTNRELEKSAKIQKQARPQRAQDPLSDPNFIGPRAQVDRAGRERIDNARRLLVTRKQLAQIQAEEERRAQALLKTNRQLADAVGEVSEQSKGAAGGTGAVAGNLDELSRPALRYALYDVANSIRQISVALAAAGIAPVGFRIKYEREFANVVRTNDIATSSSQELRKQLLSDLRDIAQATPINWRDITDIAALAGQLGIATDLVAGFTEEVAKFAATTDLSVDAAATAFGRLNELVDGVDGQFDKLGSAILAVGVDSVATESGIVNVSQQIASMGNLAGLSAADIVGLSGAIASLGIRPELARGNITRLFSNINRSVAESGFALTEYGRLTGRTAEEFADAWRSEPTEVLLDFFGGLQAEGDQAERTLRDLGITSVRDIPAFLRLGQNIDLVRRLVELSNEEFEKGTKTNEQYGIIAGTTAEQLRRLAGNGELLLASFGSLEGPLSGVLAVLNKVLTDVSDFAETDLGQQFALVGGGVAIALAALTAFAAAAAFSLAGIVAFRFVIKDLDIDLSSLNLKVLFSSKALDAMGLSAIRTSVTFRRVAASAKFLGAALGLIGIAATIAGLAFDAYRQRQERLGAITQQIIGDTNGLTESLNKDRQAVEDGAESFRVISAAQYEASDSAIDYSKAIDIATDSINPLGRVVRGASVAYEELTKEQEKSAEETERAEAASKEFVSAQEDVNQASRDGAEALNEQAEAASNLSDEYIFLGENFARFIQQQAAESPEILAAFEIEGLRESVEAEFGGFPGLTEFIVGNPDEARVKIKELITQLQEEAVTGVSVFGIDGEEIERLNLAEEALLALIDAVDSQAFINQAKSIEAVTEGLPDLAEASDIAEGKIDILIDRIFGAENAANSARESIRDFFADLEDGADSSDIANESFQKMVESIAGNSFRTPRERIADLNVVLAQLEAEGQGNSAMAQALRDVMIQLAVAAGILNNQTAQLPENFSSANVELQEFIGTATPLLNLMGLVGTEVEETGSSFGGAAEEVKTLAEEFDELLDSIFDPVNALQDQASAVADLGEAYGELGSGAFFASDEIQDAVRAITDAAESPEQAVANLNALFNELARTVGSSTDPSLQFLRNTINQVAAEFGIAADQAAAFANIDLSFFQAGVEQVQEEVRTLLDYGSDLDEVISRAFDIRYSEILQIDRIADAWDDLADRINDATDSIEELKAAQEDLSADRAIKEYFLSVAESYGDMLRAAQLRDEIAELDRQQAENARELRQQQLIAGGDLTGTEPASRESRAALLDLVKEYQDYIVTLAETGASQDELREATAQAREEFIQQATELGYQEEVVLEYAKAFDDVTTAIDNVPRDITVDANVDPALQALNELNAKLNESIDLAEKLNRVTGAGGGNGSSNDDDGPSGPREQSDIVIPYRPGQGPDTIRVDSAGNASFGEIIAGNVTVTSRGPTNVRQADGPDSNLTGAAAIRARGFSSGGYTGPGGKYEPAGVVHRGEYVVPKNMVNQSSGLPSPGFLAQMQQMQGYANGGFVGGMAGGLSENAVMVELSPFDRKLLQDAGNVQLRLNGRVVAEATNESNFNQARRGSG